MKRCPTCNRTFTDQNLSFCTDDGTPLQSLASADSEVTLVRPSTRENDPGFPEPSGPSVRNDAPGYQPPGSYVPPGYTAPSKRKAWPWILALLALVFIVFAGLGIAAAIIIPKMLQASSNTNSSNFNANTSQPNEPNSNLNDRNSNLNSNSAAGNANTNDNSADDGTAAPTNEAEVLQRLTDLEQEWTVANINADKKKLDRILADDYVGSSADGKPQGKAEYLRTATRDTSIQNWKFEDLKLSLKGDRATLQGVINLDVRNDQGENLTLAFRFTDKFVWRDARWQATGSEVTPIK